MSLDIFIDDWVDAKKLSKQYPEKFDIPEDNEIIKIVIGDFVKICNGKERFWVEVTEIKDDYLLGRIDNEIFTGLDYKKNSIIMFERKNIYDIHDVDLKNNAKEFINNKLLQHLILCKNKNKN